MKCATSGNCYRNSLICVSALGIAISIYAFHVESRMEEDDQYEALCDISERVSCTKVFSSKYGRGMGIVGLILGDGHPLNQPNGLFGVFHYSLLLLLSFISSASIARLQVVLSGLSVLLSFYLAYLLYFILDDFCIVCVSLYVVNFATLYLANGRHKQLVADPLVNPRCVGTTGFVTIFCGIITGRVTGWRLSVQNRRGDCKWSK